MPILPPWSSSLRRFADGAGLVVQGRQPPPDRAGAIPASAILDEVCRVSPGKLILVEGGPRLLGDFYAERLVAEQFLTLAPQIAGRDAGDRRPSLVMGTVFAPRNALWGTLIDVRRGSSHLFLRYAFA